jgi:hypothetical protein
MKKLSSIAIDSAAKTPSDFDKHLANKELTDKEVTSPTPKKTTSSVLSQVQAIQGESIFGSKSQAVEGSIFGSKSKAVEGSTSIFGSTEPSIFGSFKSDTQSAFTSSAFSAPSKDSTGTSSFGALLEEAASPDAEDEEDSESSAIITLTKKEGKFIEYLTSYLVILTGEEDEICEFQSRCKLYSWDEASNNWRERGVGHLKMLKSRKGSARRLVMRTEQVMRLILNIAVTGVSQLEDKYVRIVGEEEEGTTKFLIKVCWE